MRVKCKKILTNKPNRQDLGNQTEDLHVGGIYIILRVVFLHNGIIFYQIEGDGGDIILFEADQFDVVSNYIPSNWETEIKVYEDGKYYLNLAPKNWNDAPLSFYEEIVDVESPLEKWRDDPYMPDVMKLYFQEKDIIYKEEAAFKANNPK